MVFAGLFSALVKQEAAAAVATNYSTIFSNVTEPSFYWDFRTTTPLSDATGDYVEEIVNGSTTSIKARAVGNLQFNSLSGPDITDNNYIDIEDFKFGGAMSIEVYFNFASFTNTARVIDFASAAQGGDNIILRKNSSTGLVYQLRSGTSNAIQVTPTIFSGLTTNTFYHVILTCDSNGVMESYVDGTDRNMSTTFNAANGGIPDVTRILNHVGDDTWISGSSTSSGQALNGKSAFIRVWYGHVLSQAEVTSLYGNRTLIGNDKAAATVIASNFNVASELGTWAAQNDVSQQGVTSTLPYNQLYDTFTVSGSSNSFANGDYRLEVTDMNTSFTSGNGNCINQVFQVGGGHPGYDWPGGTNYYSQGVAKTSGSIFTETIDTNNNSYYGSAIQLTMPYSLVLKEIQIQSSSNAGNRPEDVSLLGSNDGGTTWDFIVSTVFTNASATAIETKTPTITNTTAYSTIRMVIQTFTSTGSSAILEYWNLIGDVY